MNTWIRFRCPSIWWIPHNVSFIKLVLPQAVKHNLGVIAMKTVANGRILEHSVAQVKDCLTYGLEFTRFCNCVRM